MTSEPRAWAPTARRVGAVIATLWLLGTGPASGQTSEFVLIGDLPGGAVASFASDVSADGEVVVGWSEGANGRQAVEWTAGAGLVGLGVLSASTWHSEATGVSSDGQLIVGSSRAASGGDRAVRFLSGGPLALPGQSCSDCDAETRAEGVSADSSVIVGSSIARPGGSSSARQDAVRWPASSFALSDLGNLSASIESGVTFGASASGLVLTGKHRSARGTSAFVWEPNQMVELASLLPTGPVAAAGLDVAGDGSVIVGYANDGVLTLPGGTVVAVDARAVRWSGAGFGTVETLGPLPDGSEGESRALAVSATGDLIVGETRDASGEDTAFLWTAADGMRTLDVVFDEDYGLDTGGWSLDQATSVHRSSVGGIDQIVIVGGGRGPAGELGGWRATLIRPACRDGLDSDGDSLVDFPADPGCTSPNDESEEFDCEDGLDNDGDGLIDFPADSDCDSPLDVAERPACSDGVDNDGNGLVDYPNDFPQCESALDAFETPQCADTVDNDGDGFSDFPADLGCADGNSPREAPISVAAGDLIVLDHSTNRVVHVDGSGVQTLLLDQGQLTEASGIAQWGTGFLVGDPGGVNLISPDGVHQIVSDPLVSSIGFGLASGPQATALFVIVDDGIARLPMNGSGFGPLESWFSFDPMGSPSAWSSTAMAVEPSGSVLAWGQSVLGGELYRFSAGGLTESLPSPSTVGVWAGMVLEPSGDAVLVGVDLFAAALGVFRLSPATGGVVPLNTTFGFQQPNALSRAESGELYVADAVDCTTVTCVGARIIEVDPTTGQASVLTSGGFLTGQVSLVAVPEPGFQWILLGVLGIAVAPRSRPGRVRRQRALRLG